MKERNYSDFTTRPGKFVCLRNLADSKVKALGRKIETAEPGNVSREW